MINWLHVTNISEKSQIGWRWNLGGVSVCVNLSCMNLSSRLNRNQPQRSFKALTVAILCIFLTIYWLCCCSQLHKRKKKRKKSASGHLLTPKMWMPKIFTHALIIAFYFFVAFGFIFVLIYHTTITSLKTHNSFNDFQMCPFIPLCLCHSRLLIMAWFTRCCHFFTAPFQYSFVFSPLHLSFPSLQRDACSSEEESNTSTQQIICSFSSLSEKSFV